MSVAQYITFYLLLVIALFKILGVPPVSMWFKHPKSCERCKGIGWHL